jgi:hypothetical protein
MENVMLKSKRFNIVQQLEAGRMPKSSRSIYNPSRMSKINVTGWAPIVLEPNGLSKDFEGLELRCRYLDKNRLLSS